MTIEVDDKRIKEDADKIVKIHNLIVKLYPDEDVYIDVINNKIEIEVRERSGKWMS